MILENVRTVGSESVLLDDALGRTLVEPVVAPVDHPPWDNSGMDGFAVHAEDVRGASEAAPQELRVIEDIRAGDLPSRAVARGEASRIMTGAPIPAGADSVIRVEHTRAHDDRVIVFNDADAQRNVRARGEDVRAGSLVFESGTLLGPAQIGVLAMLGVAAPRVSVRPRVAVLATGNELVEAD